MFPGPPYCRRSENHLTISFSFPSCKRREKLGVFPLQRSCRADSEDAGQEALSWCRRGYWMCPPVSQEELFWSVNCPQDESVWGHGAAHVQVLRGGHRPCDSHTMCISATKRGINTLFCLGTPFNLLARFSYTSPDSQLGQ